MRAAALCSTLGLTYFGRGRRIVKSPSKDTLVMQAWHACCLARLVECFLVALDLDTSLCQNALRAWREMLCIQR